MLKSRMSNILKSNDCAHYLCVIISTRNSNSLSFRREVLYNILIEFGIPMKFVRPIKMCLNETYIKSV
jgi:hypothetical protein